MIELGTAIKETLDLVKDGILFIDREFSVVFINKAAAKLFGKKEQDIVGQNCAAIFLESSRPDQTTPSFQCPCSEVLKTGNAISTLYRLFTPGAAEKILQITASPVINENGETIQVLEIIRDVTSEKKSEEALRQSEEKFKSLSEESPNMIYINKKGRIVYVNRICEEIMGYTKEEFYSDQFDFMCLIAPESKDIVKENFSRHMRGEEITSYGYNLVTKGGSVLNAIHNAKLINFEGEKAILGIVTDVTDRKLAEGKLRIAITTAEEEKLKSEAIIASVGDALGIVDTNFKIVYQNLVSKKMFGDFFGQYCYEAYQGKDQVCEGCPVFKAMKENKIQRVERTRYTDAGTMFLEITASPMIDSEGKIIGGVEVVRDITDRKKTEEDVLHYGERLRLLREIDHAIITAQTTDKIVRVALNHIKELVPCIRASIVLFDFQTDQAELLVLYSKGETQIKEGEIIQMKEFGVDESLHFGEVHVIEDLKTLSNPSRVDRQLIKEGVRSCINVPIIHLDELIGTINVCKDAPSAFTSEDVTIASEVADLLAVTIQSKRADQELRESEKKYRDLADNALVGIYKSNLKGDILYVNDALLKMSEFESLEEIISSGQLRLYRNPKDRENFVAKLKADGKVENFETEMLTKTGKVKRILKTSTLRGEIISGMMMDVTELRQAETAVKESEVFLASILEGIKDGVVVLDREFKILFTNKAYIEQSVCSSKEVKGRYCYEVSYDRNEPCYLKGREGTVKNVFDSGISSRDIRRKGERFMEMTVYPLKNSAGEVTSVVEIRRDDTRKIQKDEELKERVRELEEFYDMAVGREMKMKQLKENVEALKEELKKNKKIS
ncbi:MAG TPA: PAS domain S-box protein [Nitrospirae bacterium]|nr:PAS domain S-box protein [Nitrospirota bacterium]